jgi:hypothetical protein
MKEAFGSESRRLRASPSIKSYWLRGASSAIAMMLRRFDNSGAWKARPLLHPHRRLLRDLLLHHFDLGL